MGSQPLLGQIMMVSFGYPPKGWALCNGQLLSINQNAALFSILGTTYGGDGRTTFGLPNLQGRVPLHMGSGFSLGQRGGEEAHSLVVGEIPAHQHGVIASSASANAASPIGAFLANSGNTNFASVDANLAVTPLSASAVSLDGGSQPHENRSPYLAINFVIALQGVFPSRS